MASAKPTLTNPAYATYNTDGGRDFTSLAAWEIATDVTLTSGIEKHSVSNVSARLTPGEAVSFAPSGATATFIGHSVRDAPGDGTFMYYDGVGGVPTTSDTVTGGTSGSTADVDTVESTDTGCCPVLSVYAKGTGGHDDTVLMSGTNTSSTFFRAIESAPGEGFDTLVPGTGPYFDATASAVVFSVGENHSSLWDIEARKTMNGSSGRACLALNVGLPGALISCIAGESTNANLTNGTLGFNCVNGSYINCLAIKQDSGGGTTITHGTGFGINGSTPNIYNCTATENDNAGTGISKNGNYHDNNVVVAGTDVENDGSITMTGTNNPSAINQNGSTPTYAASTYKITVADTVLKDNGTSLAADANYPFDDDALGTSRPQGVEWDMGPFELEANVFNEEITLTSAAIIAVDSEWDGTESTTISADAALGIDTDFPVDGSFDPALTRSDSKQIGTWRIDQFNLSSPGASIGLKELKSRVKLKLPQNVFTRDDWPVMEDKTEGKPVPIAYGTVKGAKGFPVNTTTNRFKVLGHGVESFTAFYDEDGINFTPDTINLGLAEFTWLGWDGEVEVFADFIAEGENPVDCVKLLLTDPDKGANLPLADLDTASTGKGFGSNGARLDYVYGTQARDDAEVVEFPIGLYMGKGKDVFGWISDVAAAAFGIIYIDRAGLYQYKAWQPEVSESLMEITDGNIIERGLLTISASDPVTKAIVRFDQNHGLDGVQVRTHEDDRLRQLRGLTIHSVLDTIQPISSKFGAIYWGERTVMMRGRPRRKISYTVTQEFAELEPGDYVRVVDSVLGIDEVWEVLEATAKPGSVKVPLVLIDVRGLRNREGFWTIDAPVFPANLGGGSMDPWDSTWTDAQKKYALENAGYWNDDDSYIDKTDDPQATYLRSLWI